MTVAVAGGRQWSETVSTVALILGAVACGWIVASGFGVTLVIVSLLTMLTWSFPGILPAVLLVGPGFLHLATYLTSGSAVRGDILSDPVRFVPILAALFGPPVIRALTNHGPLRKRVFAPGGAGRWFAAGMLGLLLVVAIRVLGSPTPVYGLTKTLGFAAYSVFPALLLMTSARRWGDAERILNAMIVIGAAWLGLSVLIAISHGNLELYRADPGALLGGTNQAAGGLGETAGVVAIASLAGLVSVRRFRTARIGVATLAIAVLVLSGHRGSFFGFVLAVIAFTYALSRTRSPGFISRRVLIIVCAVGLGLWLGWSNAPLEVQQRFSDSPFESESFADRTNLQTVALAAWRESPLIGNGTGSSAFFIAGGDQPAFGVVDGIYPHNVTVELLTEVGVLGAALFLVTILGLLVKTTRALPLVRSEEWAVPALFAMVVQAFVIAQGYADLTIQNDLWLLSAMLGLALAPVEERAGAAFPKTFNSVHAH
jgi:O-antigen ligase